MSLRDEHIGSRKDWGAYIDLTTALHLRTVAQVDEYLAQVRARLQEATRQREWAGQGSNLRPWD